MIIRIFDTAIDSTDVDKAKELFRDVVRPAFESFPGCRGIEMFVGVEDHSRDLVELAAVSRWDSVDAIATAIDSHEYASALTELRTLFAQAPLVRHFDRVD